MQAIEEAKKKPEIDPIMYEFLAQVGKHKGGLTGFVLRSKPLVRAFVKPKLMERPPTRAAISNTFHLTGTGGSGEPNVVPSEAWAQYDCRLLPGVEPQQQLEQLRAWTSHIDGLTIEDTHHNASSQSPIDDPLYNAIARYAVENNPKAVAAPALSVGFTDSLFARQRGVHAYGYAPFLLTADEAQTMHGHNEKLSVENMHNGLKTLFSVVVEVAGQPID
jgi:acetylornithine deacetylase/succinyl-diaminopimelate desuccinylase-like protein